MVLLSKKTSRNYWEMSRRSQFERLKSCSVENIFSILHLIINYHNGLNLLSRGYIKKLIHEFSRAAYKCVPK